MPMKIPKFFLFLLLLLVYTIFPVTPWGITNNCWAVGTTVLQPSIGSISKGLNISTYDTCSHLKEAEFITPQNPQEAQRMYDTLRLYVEQCAAIDNSSYLAFSALREAVSHLSASDTSRYRRFREWLISVIYLNTTESGYFCACLGTIVGTYGSNDPFPNSSLAVLRYALSLPNCYSSTAQKQYDNSIENLIQSGKDTTIPPLDSIGLGFLLTHNSVSPSTVLPTMYLASFTSSPNPYKTETTLSFELNRMAYITVEVFDPLGRKVWGDDHGYSLDKGIHTVHLDGAKFSSGTYYARISTGFGEVKTVKLVKQ